MLNSFYIKLLLIVGTLVGIGAGTHASAQAEASSKDLDQLSNEIPLVISDVDDTLKQTYVRASGNQRWKFYWYASRTDSPFAAVSQVLYNLVCTPAPLYNSNCENYDDDSELSRSSLYYVTGSPGPLSKFGSEFLEDMQFPQGFLYFRPLGQNSTRDYKIGAIRKILSQNTQKSFVVFIGDNGQYDAEVYNKVAQGLSQKQITLIRSVYASPIASPLFPGQLAFFTSADLALALYLHGLLESPEVRSIIASTLKSYETNPSAVIPDFMSCSSWRMELSKLQGLIRYKEHRDIYDETWSALLQICK